MSESSLSEMEEINTGKVEALEKYGKSFVYVEDATTKHIFGKEQMQMTEFRKRKGL